MQIAESAFYILHFTFCNFHFAFFNIPLLRVLCVLCGLIVFSMGNIREFIDRVMGERLCTFSTF
jgi:hypothetical protein